MDRFMKKPAPGAAAAKPPTSRPPESDEEEEEEVDEEEEEEEERPPPRRPQPLQRPPEDEDDEEDDEEEDDDESPPPSKNIDPRFAKKPVASAVPPPAAATRAAPASRESADAARRRAEAEREAAIAAARRVRHRGRDSDEDGEDDEDDEDATGSEDEEDEDEDTMAADAESSKKYRQPKLRFDLDTFSSSFDAGAFVSDLTRDLFAQQSPSDFDPAPFQTLFDSALARLHALRDETDRNILRCVRDARTADDAHRDTVSRMHEQLGTVLAKFRRLDGRISSVAHTAVRIGHTLQSVDQQKKFNLQGQEIIQHFLAFNQGDPAKLLAIFSTSDPAELHRAAALIQLLSSISQDLRVAGTEKAASLIASTSNDIENQLISRFDAASKGNGQNSLQEMKACAATLLNFRGKSIIKRYVFNVIEKLEMYARRSPDTESGAPSAPSSSKPGEAERSSIVLQFQQSLSRLYRGVTVALKEQCAVCAVIFPHPLSVIKAILERVFQDKIQGLVDSALGEHKLKHEEFLAMLDFAHAHTQDLVNNILAAIKGITNGAAGGGVEKGPISEKSNGSIVVPPSVRNGVVSVSSSLNGSSVSGSGLGGSAGGGADHVQLMNLHDQVQGIFGSYREQYMSREIELMEQVSSRAISSVMHMEAARPASHSASGAAGAEDEHSDDTDMFGRLKKSVVADQKQKWILLVLEQPLVDKLMAHSTQALQRCDRLSDPGSLADNASQLFLLTAANTIENYVQPVLDQAMQFLPPPDPKTEPDPFFFQLVGLVGLVVDKVQLHYTLFALPRISTNPNSQLITDARVRELMGKLEIQLSSALASLLQSHIRYVARLLSNKQRSTDYKPREDDSDAVLDGKPSPACDAVCRCVQGQIEAVTTALDGKNLDKYLHVMGMQLHDVLVAHLQKLTISTMGAGLLARDMKEYQRVLSSFPLSAVQEAWAELRQVVDLFFVGPDHLRAVINDSGKLSKMAITDQAQLIAWIQRRADYSDNKKRILTALHLRDDAQ